MNVEIQLGNRRFGGSLSVPFIFLILYLFFMFAAQQTLLPMKLSSLSLYGMIGSVALEVLRLGRVRLTGFTAWYIIMMLWSAVSLLYATAAEVAVLYTMFVALVVTFCTIYIVDQYSKFDICVRFIAYSGILMCLMLAGTGQIATDVGERLGESVTGNANIFSALLMAATVCASWILIYKAKRKEKCVLYVGLLFLLYIMALSGGRKTVIAVVATFLFLYVFKDLNSSMKLLKNIVIAVILFMVAYSVMMEIPALYESIGIRFEGLLSFVKEGESNVSSDYVRQEMITIGIEKWKESPIWGYGLNTFKYYNREVTGHFYYAHNNYVELLYDLGIVGFLIYYAMIVKLAFDLWNLSVNLHGYKMFGLGMILMLLIYDIGGISFYTVFSLILLSLGYIVVYIARENL